MLSSITSINPALSFIIYALAVWRVSSLFVYEDGPLDIFGRLRALIGVRYADDSSRRYATNKVAGAFICLWCFSVWAGGVMLLLWLLLPIIMWVYLILAASAAAIMIEGFFIVR